MTQPDGEHNLLKLRGPIPFSILHDGLPAKSLFIKLIIRDSSVGSLYGCIGPSVSTANRYVVSVMHFSVDSLLGSLAALVNFNSIYNLHMILDVL